MIMSFEKMTRTIKVYLCFAIVIVAFSATGCATSGIEGSATVVTGSAGQTVSTKYVIINNKRLARGIQIVDLKPDFVGDVLRASVSVVNKYSKTLNFQYKFSWFDENGREIDPDSDAWTPVLLYGNESKELQGIAPNSSAKEFKIKIRKL
ncbi:MAG TPA: YcfL family protein [Candidatus Brocadiaceae bacterium]